MRRAKRWIDQEKKFRKLVAQQAKSGLSARRFADRKGLSYDTFIRWRRRLREEAEETSEPSEFIPVRVDPTPAPSSGYEFVLRSGSVLRIPARGFDPDELKGLVEALESVC